MPNYAKIVTIGLVASIALNIYLLWPVEQTSPQDKAQLNQPVSSTTTLQTSARQSPKASRDTSPPHTYQPLSITIDTARQLLNQGEFARVERFLIEALRSQPDSADLLLLEADYILATEPLSSAVVHLYSLLDLPVFNPAQQESLAARAYELTENTINALYNAGDWDLLAQFIEPLFQLNSGEQVLTLKLAEAYARQQKYTLMEDVLANLPPNNAGANSIRQRFLPQQGSEPPTDERTPNRSTASDTTRLALTRYGDQYIANTQILNRPAALLLDTGASSTAISWEFYRRLKRFNTVRIMGLFDVQTAGGSIRAPLIQIESMTVGPYELSNIGVLVLPGAAMQNADGLLGMNVLKQFHFQLDQSTAELLLSPR